MFEYIKQIIHWYFLKYIYNLNNIDNKTFLLI